MCAPNIRWPSNGCKTAIRQAERLGLLGNSIFGTALQLQHSICALGPARSSAAKRRR